MPDEDIYTSARAWWVLNRARAEREKYAVVTAGGTAIQVIEIADWCTYPGDGRHAFSGKILSAGHPVYDRYVRKPLTAASRNPIHYLDDADDPAGTCKCGCGKPTGGTWSQAMTSALSTTGSAVTSKATSPPSSIGTTKDRARDLTQLMSRARRWTHGAGLYLLTVSR